LANKIKIRMLLIAAVLWATAAANAAELDDARAKYNQTQYREALAVLAKSSDSAGAQLLAGQCHYFLRDYRKAIGALERAAKAAPNSAAIHHWLGRAWGRRAESANPFQAPGFAVKARKAFEQAVALDPALAEAASDLLEYYLEAPGFLGGGIDKAVALAEKNLKPHDAAQYHFALAQIARKRKQDDVAERELRRAAELQPGASGRLAGLARFVAQRGRVNEAEELFAKAAKLEPNAAGWRYAQAQMYAEAKTKTEEARRLIEQMLKLPLTPDDPSREEAQALLARLR
jgi:tetratricopeptide (TPR) repeat protein